MHTCGSFMLMFGRNQHNIAKQYPLIKNKVKQKKRKLRVSFDSGCEVEGWEVNRMLCPWDCI